MSKFRDDGWQDHQNGEPFSPPDIPVLAAEYAEGWNEYGAMRRKPPYPFCFTPTKCAASGRCERDICCAD